MPCGLWGHPRPEHGAEDALGRGCATSSSRSNLRSASALGRGASHLGGWSAGVRACSRVFVGVVTQLDTQRGQRFCVPTVFMRKAHPRPAPWKATVIP